MGVSSPLPGGGKGIEVQGIKTYVVDKGSGTPTLFLHGVPDSSEEWRDVVARLQGSYHCIAPDLPGLGRSAPANFAFTLDNMADYIEALVNALGINEPINLVAHDFGGPYGLSWAIKHPERVRSIAIFSTNFFSDYKWHPLAKQLRTPVLGELGMMLINEKSFIKQMAPTGFDPAYLSKVYRLTLAKRKGRQTMLKLYRSLNPTDFVGWQDKLTDLTKKVPTMVFWGDKDPFIPINFADRFGGTVKHYPDGTHWLMVQYPDDVATTLAEFMG